MAGCCSIGIKIVNMGGTLITTLTPTDLMNPSHPGATYKALSLIGSSDTPVRLVLPVPASDDDAYNLEIENRSLTNLIISNNPADTVLGGEAFLLRNFAPGRLEASLEEEIVDGATTVWTYRTLVLVRVSGAYRVPGFTKPLVIG